MPSTAWTASPEPLLAKLDQHRLRERVADAFGSDARHFRDRHVDDPPLVRVERPELLVDARVPRLLREGLRHLWPLGVLAFAVLERVDEDTLFAFETASVRRVDD